MPRIKSLDSFSSVHGLIFVHAGKTIGSLTLRHVSYPQYCQKYRCSLTAYSCLKFVSNSLSGILTHKYTRIRGLFYAGIGEPRDTETYRRFSLLAYDLFTDVHIVPYRSFYLCIVQALTDSKERIALETCLRISRSSTYANTGMSTEPQSTRIGQEARRKKQARGRWTKNNSIGSGFDLT